LQLGIRIWLGWGLGMTRTGIGRLGSISTRMSRLRLRDDLEKRVYCKIYKTLHEDKRNSKTAAGE
jgi:hypothetical protein